MLSAINLTNFRGYSELSLDLEGPLTILVGDNAQGKTNFLRALEVLGLGDSRELAGPDLIRFGASQGRIEGCVERAGLRERLLAGLSTRGARLFVNGKAVTRPRWVGRLPVLFVGPEDRSHVTGPPAARRALLDELLEQCEPAYLSALREYRRALRQRNRALAQGVVAHPEEIEIWEEPLARAGGILLSSREQALAALAPRTQAWYRELAGDGHPVRGPAVGGDLVIAYQTEMSRPAGRGSPETWSDALRAAYASARERERAWGSTLVGPHRDDVAISLRGRALKGIGSAGEIWNAIVALALSFAEHLGQQCGSLPLLLLDDVLSVLDPSHGDRLLGVVQGLPQVFLTTTQCPAGVGASAVVYEVRRHQLARLEPKRTVTALWEEEKRSRDLFVRC